MGTATHQEIDQIFSALPWWATDSCKILCPRVDFAWEGVMVSIRHWLNDLGLEQYANTFEENEITLEFVGDLTDADLKGLGITAMGDNRH